MVTGELKREHILVRIGRERFDNPEVNSVHLVNDQDANAFLNDLVNFPHAYVLACCMDRQTKAERAWMIPIKIRDNLGSFDMKVLASKSADDYNRIFTAVYLAFTLFEGNYKERQENREQKDASGTDG